MDTLTPFTPLGYLVMFTLPAVVLALFWLFPPRQAVIYSFIWGWFFLPMKAFNVHGMTEYSKLSATPLCVLLAALLFDTDRVLALRPRIWDVPMLVYLICPFFSSMHNDLGPYDGANAAVNQFYLWGGGYLIGRIYFTDLDGLRDLAFGFILGGLIYVPFCLWEVRMSPQLHYQLYGFAQHAFAQTQRFGGYRPIVFMQHGIALGVWMISTALTAWWLWLCGTFKHRWHMAATFWVIVLFVTVVLCRALEAAALMTVGIAVLTAVKYFWRPLARAVLFALVFVPPVYIYLRANNLWAGDQMVRLAEKINEDRAASLAFRLHNEDVLAARAAQSPIFGWGGWSRFESLDVSGRMAVPDQQWIIAYGKTGLVGLVSLLLTLLMPLLILMRRLPLRYWTHPAAAPAVVLAVIVTLHMWDCLLNAMVNPMFMMACGGLSGLSAVTIRVVQQKVTVSAAPQSNRPIQIPAAPAIQ
ncbi:MAG: O-antigen ligase domain-containing protein [Tepidisphaeraceae bacterium]|jgi:ABC-type sugar transport system permease subunit